MSRSYLAQYSFSPVMARCASTEVPVALHGPQCTRVLRPFPDHFPIGRRWTQLSQGAPRVVRDPRFPPPPPPSAPRDPSILGNRGKHRCLISGTRRPICRSLKASNGSVSWHVDRPISAVPVSFPLAHRLRRVFLHRPRTGRVGGA